MRDYPNFETRLTMHYKKRTESQEELK